MDNRQATLELGTKPVGKLLTQYAIPAIIAMTASSLYNMIDSIFIGQGVGPLAISGLAITFPLMNLSAAFGAAVGVGASTCISVKLGQKDYRMAERIFGNSITLNAAIGAAFSIIALIFLNPILYFFGASDNTLVYAREYMIVILGGNIFSHMFLGMNAILRAAGKPRHAMYATIFTVMMNIVLAPAFIWWLGLGIQGAAYATILSQTTGMVWQFKLFGNKREILHLRNGIYRLEKDIVKNIIGIGVSPFSMNLCACIVVVFINTQLAFYGGDMAVGAFGIANRMAFIFLMVTMGVNQGMLPIAGYNYGAQNIDRLMRVLKYALIAGMSITTTGFIISHVIPYQCARLFTTDQTLIRTAVRAMQINMLAFPLVGGQMVITNFFQSIGKAKISIFLSLSRQMLFLLPLLVIMPRVLKLDGVWMSIPTADTITSVISAIMIIKYIKKIKRQNKSTTYGGREENNN